MCGCNESLALPLGLDQPTLRRTAIRRASRSTSRHRSASATPRRIPVNATCRQPMAVSEFEMKTRSSRSKDSRGLTPPNPGHPRAGTEPGAGQSSRGSPRFADALWRRSHRRQRPPPFSPVQARLTRVAVPVAVLLHRSQGARDWQRTGSSDLVSAHRLGVRSCAAETVECRRFGDRLTCCATRRCLGTNGHGGTPRRPRFRPDPGPSSPRPPSFVCQPY